MKKLFIVVLLCAAGAALFAQSLTFEDAIQAVSQEMAERIPRGSKVAVLNFTGPSEQLSRYVIEELNNAIVNEGWLTVVDRRQLDLIMQEMQFQESGFVSEESAQEIGRLTGAQYIISGSMERIGQSYRFRAQALGVETAVIAYSYSRTVEEDAIVRNLAGANQQVQDFTEAERKSAKTMNLVFGLGSFVVQKDIAGGSIIAALETGGLACAIIGVVNLVETGDISEPKYIYDGGAYYEFDGKRYNYWDDAQDAYNKAYGKKEVTGGILLVAGVALSAAGAIFGFVRPSSDRKSVV
jgi:TolB-like protein